MASKDLSVAKKGKKLAIFSIWDEHQPKTQFSAWKLVEGLGVKRESINVYFCNWKKGKPLEQDPTP
mgnify:FL=1|jgi:hypothetical protein